MHKTYILTSVLVVASGCSPSADDREALGESSQALTSGHAYNLGTLAHPGSCMDVASAGTADGTNIQEWTCNGTGAQSFQLQAIDSTWYKIVNTASGKCVDAAANGTADGTNVQLWTCNGTGAQAWQFVASGSFFQIVEPQLVLHVRRLTSIIASPSTSASATSSGSATAITSAADG